MVILNFAGEVTEAAVSNIAFVRDGVLITPPSSAGILGGITRGLVLGAVTGAAGIRAGGSRCRPEDFPAMQECLLLSTTKDIAPVASIDDSPFRVGPDTTTARLKAAFGEYARRYAEEHPDRNLLIPCVASASIIGARRWGLAYGDDLGVATPLRALVQSDPARRWSALAADRERRGARPIWCWAIPYNMDGSAGAKAKEVDASAARLRAEFGLPVHLVDERLTSYEAEATIPKARRREVRGSGIVDSRAATILLQDFLGQRHPLL